MAGEAEQVSTKALVDTKQGPGGGRRRRWSEALKRRIVAETQEPGSSVSIVARRHDVNANQLFQWRRELLPKEPPSTITVAAMLPVEIVPERARPRRRAGRTGGLIEIEFGCGAKVFIRGEVAPETLRQVIELLG